MEFEEIKEKNQPIIFRDGVAPQCAVNGLEKLTKESKPTTGGRAYPISASISEVRVVLVPMNKKKII